MTDCERRLQARVEALLDLTEDLRVECKVHVDRVKICEDEVRRLQGRVDSLTAQLHRATKSENSAEREVEVVRRYYHAEAQRCRHLEDILDSVGCDFRSRLPSPPRAQSTDDDSPAFDRGCYDSGSQVEGDADDEGLHGEIAGRVSEDVDVLRIRGYNCSQESQQDTVWRIISSGAPSAAKRVKVGHLSE